MHRRKTVAWIAALALAVTVVTSFAAPPLATPKANATTLPSGMQTGFQIDGDKTAGTLPNTFDWDNFITGVQNNGAYNFTPTPAYTTPQGYSSTGIFQGVFFWDNGSMAAACDGNNPDATGSQGSQTPDSNPWVPGSANVNDKGNICSNAYATEVVTTPDGVKHVILYSYWTRRVGNGTVSVYDLFEGPQPGRCDDQLLEVIYPGGFTDFQDWIPDAGNCDDPNGSGHWQPVRTNNDFSFAMGVRTEGPIVANQQNQTFGEYAIDLTTSGFFDNTTCSTYHISTTFTRTGFALGAQIQDYVIESPNPMEITNCGKLTVKKEITPPGVSTDQFGYTISNEDGAVQPGPPPVQTISDTIKAGETKTYDKLLAGSKVHIAEDSIPPPWQKVSIICKWTDEAGAVHTQDVTNPASTFTIPPAGQTDCTILNDAAQVTVVKQTLPDGSSQPFDFDVGGHSATLTDGQSATFAFTPGSPVTINETAVSGWLPPNMQCTAASTSSGDHSVTVTAVAGQNIVCTYTNTQTATVNIVKEAVGVDGRTYSFTSNIPGHSAFDITAVLGDGTHYTQTFTNVPPTTPGNNYTVTEATDTNDPPTRLADLNCVTPSGAIGFPGSPTASFPLNPGETVTCFYTNSLPGRIFLIKLTDPVEFDYQFDFSVTPAAGGVSGFTLNGSPAGPPDGASWESPELLSGGTFVIQEAADPNWTLSDLNCTAPTDEWSADVPNRQLTIDLPDNATITCFALNTTTAQAALTKTVAGVAAGVPWNFDVSLTSAGQPARPDTVSGTGPSSDRAEWLNLVPGKTYTISETAKADFTAGTMTCTDQNGAVTDQDSNPLTFTWTAGFKQQLECAITNTAKPSTIRVNKTTTGIGLTYPWSFNLQISPLPTGQTNPKVVSGVGQSTSPFVSWGGLVPGQTYTVTEAPAPPGYTSSFSCTGITSTPVPGGFSFVAPINGSVTCGALNTAEPLSLDLVKTADGVGAFTFDLTKVGTGEDPLERTITTADVGGGSFSGSDTFTPVIPGQHYALTEVDQVGWTEGAISCTVTPATGAPFPIPDVSDFTLAVGDHASCTADNQHIPGTISFTKTTTGISDQFPWTFPISLTGPGNPQSQAVSGVGPGSDTVSWPGLDPGTYHLGEGGLAGWTAGDITCSDGTTGTAAAGVDITIALGDAVSCSATNAAVPIDVTIAKRTAGIAPGTPWSFTFTLSPAPPAPQPDTIALSGTGPGLGAATHTWTGLIPGDIYTIDETPAAGWTEDISCQAGALRDAAGFRGFQLILQPGQTFDCISDNTAQQASGTITKTAVGGNGTFDFVLDTVPSSTPTTIPVTTTAGTGSADMGVLVPGQHYSLSEPAKPGWEQTTPLACTRTTLGGTVVPIGLLSDFVLQPGDVVACTATNTALGKIIINKEAHGVDGRTFDFTSDIPGNTSFSIAVPNGDGTLYQHVINDVQPGVPYTITEAPDSGTPATELADLACTYGGADHSFDPTDRVAGPFVVQAGETVNCFFTNSVPGRIIVVKRTVPVEYDQQFDFHFANSSPLVDFSLNGNSTPPNVALWDSGPLLEGTYTVSEDAIANWSLTDITCNSDTIPWTGNLNTRTVSIDLPADGLITCFFTNDAADASMTLTKSVDGVTSSTNWSFPVTLSPTPAGDSATKTVSGTGNTSGAVTWNGIQPGVTYTLHEPTVTGWTAGPITCTGNGQPLGQSVAGGYEFVALPAMTIACAFTNTATPAQVSITKTVSGVDSGLAWSFAARLTPTATPATDQTLTGTGNSTSAPVTWTGLIPGTMYTLAELPAAGWLQGEVQCAGTPDADPITPGIQFVATPGMQLSCDVSNGAKAGSVQITKIVQGVGASLPWNVLLTISPGANPLPTQPLSGTGTAGGLSATWTNLVPGTRYTITEVAIPGWAAPVFDCMGVTDLDPVAPGITFAAQADTRIQCTVTNRALPASLSVTKSTTGADPGIPFSFPFTVSPAATPSATQNATGTTPAQGSIAWTDLVPGQVYTLTEGSTPGWTPVTLTCTGVTDTDPSPTVVQFIPNAGESIVCAATNAANPASVTVTKTVTGVDASLPWSFDFTLRPADAPEPATQQATGTGPGSDTTAWTGLVPGRTYTLTETAVAGWTGGLVCSVGDLDPGTPGVQFTAIVGQPITCSAANNAQPGSGTITKNSNGKPGSFDFALTKLPSGAPVTINVTTSASGAGSAPLPALTPGAHYSLAEVDQAGWDEGTLSCLVSPAGGGTATPVNAADFMLNPGDDIACSVSNTPLGRIVIAKAVDGPDSTFHFTDDWTGQGGFDVSTSGGTGSQVFADIQPGTYHVSEVAPTGYANTKLICTDSDGSGTASVVTGLEGTINLDPLETVTCTFTNVQWGVLVVDKVTRPAGSGDSFGFTLGPTGGAATDTFALTDKAPPFTSAPLRPGMYTVTESTLPSGPWSLAGLDCTGSTQAPVYRDSAADVRVDAGTTVVCTYTNTRPRLLNVTKTVVGTPVEGPADTYTVTYEVKVESLEDLPQMYTLVDQFKFGGGIVIESAKAVSLEGIALEPDWNGQTKTRLATAVAIAGLATHTYRITVVGHVGVDTTTDAQHCANASTTSPGTAFLNTTAVSLEDGVKEAEAFACVPVPHPPTPLPPTGLDARSTLWLATTALLLLFGGVAILVTRRTRRYSTK